MSRYEVLVHYLHIFLNWFNLAKKVQNCVNIPEETCRDVPVPKCKSVPYKKPVYKTLTECSKCEQFDDVVVDIGYHKNCQRLEKQSCHTEYKEVNNLGLLNHKDHHLILC